MSFDIEQAIVRWRRQLTRAHRLEPGYLEELECGLRDRIDEYRFQGFDDQAAFEKARQRVCPELQAGQATAEMQKVNSSGSALGLAGEWTYLLPNYLKLALRNLRRRRFYSGVNYLSLVAGLLFTALAGMYIHYETSFDTFYDNVDRKFRLGRQFRAQDYSVMSFPQYFRTSPEEQMRQLNAIADIKGVVQACQFFTFWQSSFVETEEKRIPIASMLQTNTPAAFFEFFGWPFLSGSAAQFSAQPRTAVLTRSEAEKLYGPDWAQKELVGRTLRVDTLDFTVAGVIEDIPPNAHYDFTIALHTRKIDYWSSRMYVELAEGVDPQEVADRMDAQIGKINSRLAESELFGGTIIQPLPSIHLHSDMLYELEPPGQKRYLYIFGIIAGVILLITISNYTNLAIAMHAGRAREIGMRKLFGAGKGHILRQFLLEAVVLALLAVPLVMLALKGLTPRFNAYMGTGIEETILASPVLWVVLLAAGVAIGLLSGLYPALYLARQAITGLFRGQALKTNRRGITMRKLLIGFQFGLLIGLSSLTFYVNQQLHYIQHKDLGYQPEGLLYVNLSEEAPTFKAYRQALLQEPGITGVGSGSPLGRSPFNQATFQLEGTQTVFDDATQIELSYSAVNILDIETSVPDLLEAPGQAPKSIRLINETAMKRFQKQFGLSRGEVLGRRIIVEPESENDEGGMGFPFEIDGTFSDINIFSLREQVTPYFLEVYRDPEWVRWVSIGFEGIPPAKVLEHAKKHYAGLNLGRPFYHSFLTSNIEELYAQERKVGALTIGLSMVAFVVAVIGLIALTAFLTTLRQKEIGIRSILGAGRWTIVRQFNEEYLRMIGLSLMVAAPLAWYGTRRWLSSFAYHIDLSLWVMAGAALLTLTIALVAVSSITYRVASADPARALQEEQ